MKHKKKYVDLNIIYDLIPFLALKIDMLFQPE